VNRCLVLTSKRPRSQNPGGLYFVEDNAEHYEWVKGQGNWSSTELKNSAEFDSQRTRNSNKRSILSVFKKSC
jgi:hypothetical protein